MSRIKVRVTFESIQAIETENYFDEWELYLSENGDLEEGKDCPPVDAEFAIECFQAQLEDGDEQLTEKVLADASVDVEELR